MSRKCFRESPAKAGGEEKQEAGETLREAVGSGLTLQDLGRATCAQARELGAHSPTVPGPGSRMRGEQTHPPRQVRPGPEKKPLLQPRTGLKGVSAVGLRGPMTLQNGRRAALV